MPLYTIVWSSTARISYYQILEFLEDRWTSKELEFFIKRTEEVINLISDNPFLYQYSKEKNIYKCVMIKQVSMIYQFKGNEIMLLFFWDNRQDSTKLLL